RIAHGAHAPFNALHVRREHAAAVARALAHGDDLGRLELPAQLLEVELERLLRRVAADLQPPRLRTDAANSREVIAHEESIVARDRLAEVIDRRLEIRRPIAALDEWNL